MAAPKFLTPNASGPGLQENATAVVGGAADAEKIPSLDLNGKLTAAMMPTGIAADTVTVTASEALAAGDWVNIHAGGVRKADAPTNKPAHGFVLSAFASAATATVYFEGANTAVTGQTIGPVYLGTSGASTSTRNTTATQLDQQVGLATSATSIATEISEGIVRA
jgi:hypothetical protein